MTNAIVRLINNARMAVNGARSTLNPHSRNGELTHIERCLNEIEKLIAEPTEPAKPPAPIKPVSSSNPKAFTCTDLDDVGFYIRNFGNAIENTDLQQIGNYIVDWSTKQRQRNTDRLGPLRAVSAATTITDYMSLNACDRKIVLDSINSFPEQPTVNNNHRAATIAEVQAMIDERARASYVEIVNRVDTKISDALVQQEKNVERTVITVRNAILSSLDKAFKRT